MHIIFQRFTFIATYQWR